jgi:putative transposase
MRNDYAHKVTTWLVETYDAIFVEDLNIAGMLKNRRLSKSLADAAMGKILNMLAWKCEEHGVTFQTVSRWFPSSKTCHVCDCINHTLTLSDREWTCSHCGTWHDRDINAARNIQREGLKIVAAGQSET